MGALGTSAGTIGVDVRGSGGVPLLFLHGVGSDRSAWALQLDHFGEQRLAIAIDHPGYGDSEFKPDATLADFASATLAALDALGVAKAHLCGLSLGGVVALAVHAAAPARVASLVLADSFAWHPEGGAILDRSLAGLAEHGMRGLAERRVDALLGTSADPRLRAAVIETMARIDPAAYALAARAVWLADQRREAAAVTCPTLILYGSEDRITPADLSLDLKDRISGAGLVEIAGAGHLSNLEQPAIFNRVLSAFLAEAD